MGRLISGKVFDAETNQPLPFAIVAGTDADGNPPSPAEYTSTNTDGSYLLSISKSTHVGAKYTGYPRQVLPITGNTKFDFPMKQGLKLDEVVVEGKEKDENLIPDWLLWVGGGAAAIGIIFLVVSKTKKN